MSIEIEATYENGLLKLDRALPLADHQRVRLTIRTSTTVARSSYGIMGWEGSVDVLRRVALEPEHGILESP
jgi:predicted DNA-binding antitoxin AbrB/MazE fold protein